MTNRASFTAYLMEKFAGRLDDITTPSQPAGADDGWPGKNLQRNHAWAARTTGTVTFPFMQAGTKTRDDMFTVLFVFQAAGPADTIAEAKARSELYADEFMTMVAEDPGMDDMDGLIAAWFDEDNKEGPEGEPTDEGAFAQTTVELHAHIRTE